MGQEQPRKPGALGKIRLVLRLLLAAPGILVAANRKYRQFAEGFIKSACLEGMPEELAREIMAQYKPLRLFRSLSDGQSRQADEA